MKDTKIQWTDTSWNPIRGCSKVSEGCRNCYAMHVAARFSGPGQPYEGLAKRSPARWTGHARVVQEHLTDPMRWRKPRRVFVNSMSDLFHESLRNEEIAAVFGVMAAAPMHTFQVLTKRPERMRAWFRWISECAANLTMQVGELPDSGFAEPTSCMVYRYEAEGKDWIDDAPRGELAEHGRIAWPLPNVWLGVSVEDQRTADERIPQLLATPAAVRFLSAEPLLGRVDLSHHFGVVDAEGEPSGPRCKPDGSPAIDWCIVGGESGPGARVCDVEWIRALVYECREAGVSPFVKQLGALAMRHGIALRFAHPKGGDMAEWPGELRVREWPA